MQYTELNSYTTLQITRAGWLMTLLPTFSQMNYPSSNLYSIILSLTQFIKSTLTADDKHWQDKAGTKSCLLLWLGNTTPNFDCPYFARFEPAAEFLLWYWLLLVELPFSTAACLMSVNSLGSPTIQKNTTRVRELCVLQYYTFQSNVLMMGGLESGHMCLFIYVYIVT